ncbi:MAG: hypothetical protein HY543_05990 [Deltaproteobacteria bacterium]|nr:hypothetical protein [Deltaproteobacteria bacterium]
MILDHIAALLQTWYRIDNLPPLAPFLLTRAPSLPAETREALLVRPCGRDLEVGLFIAPEIVGRLAHRDPFQSLAEENLDDFCVAVEGISHWCCVLWKFQQGTPVTQLELEIQAEIDKCLCCMWLLAMQGSSWNALHAKLFSTYRIAATCPQAATRYHLASLLAARFCAHMMERYRRRHLTRWHRRLREFYRLTHWQKLRALSR